MFTESPRLKARTFLVANTPSNALHIPALSIYNAWEFIVELLIGRTTFIKPRLTADTRRPIIIFNFSR